MDNKNKKDTYAKITKEQHQKAEGQKNITREICKQEPSKQELFRKENFGKITKEQHQKMRRDSKENAKKEHKS